MADCESGCSGTCSGSCSGSCSKTCSGTCSGGCSGCTGCTGCSGTCEGTCCTGCTNDCVSACKSTCNSTCEGNCYTTCNKSCYTTCQGQCKGYCATICQTYCQKAQIFTENVSPIVNSVGKPKFFWTYPVNNTTPSTIKITASEWNTLKSYIQTATQYCGGTFPSKADASSDPNSINNFISAEKYNDLANGLGLTNVEANKTLISAKLINDLSSTYNSRKITNTLPNGEKPLTGGKDQCCQSGQTCMASGELLDHQEKTEKCGDQTTSSCGNQRPGS